jgi:hypothetical protein
MITGNINKLIVNPAAKILLPSASARTKIVKPSKPNTTDGTPAKLEIFIRMKSLILPFFAYSSKYIAEPTPNNNETGATTAIIQSDPIRAALIPAFSGKREPKFKKKSIDK